ncbi:MAG: uroporphyrinogen decarboxylase family protein, partial [Candidatus Humimicrobiaceae bacterium]
ETPVGTIESVQKYLDGVYCYAYKKHFVETINDFRVMRYVYENSIYKENYEPFLYYDKIWGEEGISFAMAMASMAPLQKLLTRWAGVEKTIDLYMDYPDEFEQTFLSIEQSQGGLVEVLANSPALVIILPENLASEVTGDYFFKHFNMPYYKKIVQKLHAASKKVAIHIDGGLIPCLGMLSECGFDIADAITPKPFGDVEVENLRQIAGKNIILWGGLPGGIFTPNYSDAFFEEHVLKVIKNADDKFVIGVADQVPPDAIPWRISRVRELVDRNLRKIQRS